LAGDFAADGARILGLTPIGQVPVSILRFNENEGLLERKPLRQLGGPAEK
jgi:hypothetical protein